MIQAQRVDEGMTADQLERALRDWGHWYGERRQAEWQEGEEDVLIGGSVHPIARAMEFAGGSGIPVGRAAASMARLRNTPAWGFDPLVCTETRSHRISTADDIPQNAQKVQSAVLILYKIEPLRSTCLRLNYCTFGSHHHKAQMASEMSGLPIKLKRFRDELLLARIWMMGRLSV